MKKIPGIILSKIFSILVFFVVLFVLNRLSMDNVVYHMWTNFLNTNAGLIVVMSLIFMISELLFALIFPFNTAAPFFSAFGALLVTNFVFRIFSLIDLMININLSTIFFPLSFIIYPIVFVAVLFGGYVAIFSKLAKKKKKKQEKEKKPKQEECNQSWDEVGEDIKKGLSGLFRKIADSIDDNKK